MKKLIVSIGILTLALGSVATSALAYYPCFGNDPEYDWVIKPEVLKDKLHIIANPVFIPGPRCGEKVVMTGDFDKWNYTWTMNWTKEGHVVNIPLNKLPKNKRIRMNYVLTGGNCKSWAQFSEDNDNEWTGRGDHGGTVIDLMIQNNRVVTVD